MKGGGGLKNKNVYPDYPLSSHLGPGPGRKSVLVSISKCGMCLPVILITDVSYDSITVAKMFTNILWMFLKCSFPRIFYCSLQYFTTPPPHISDWQHVFLLLFGMHLRHLNGWLAFIQKFPQDLIISLTNDAYSRTSLIICPAMSKFVEPWHQNTLGHFWFQIETAFGFVGQFFSIS